MEPIEQDFEKEHTLNKLADHVVSEKGPALGENVEKKKESVIVKADSAKDTIAGIPYLIEVSLTAMLTPS